MITILLFFLFFWTTFSAETCKYTAKIEECTSAINSFAGRKLETIIPGGAIKSIEDFPCIQDAPEKRVFQIAMHENFTLIDEELESYLEKLYAAKEFYFGKNAQYNYYDALNHIYEQRKMFRQKYYTACQTAYEETGECVGDEEVGSLSIKEAKDYIQKWSWICYDLVEKKVMIFTEVAYNGLLMNRQKVLQDRKMLYDHGQITKYNEVLDLMRINLSYVERLWKKTVKFMKHTLWPR